MSRTFGGNPMAGNFFSIVDLLREKKLHPLQGVFSRGKMGSRQNPGPFNESRTTKKQKQESQCFRVPEPTYAHFPNSVATLSLVVFFPSVSGESKKKLPPFDGSCLIRSRPVWGLWDRELRHGCSACRLRRGAGVRSPDRSLSGERCRTFLNPDTSCNLPVLSPDP